jgi:hypothetical protein
MADNGRHFFGADGYKRIAAMFDTPRHHKALALFRENLKRPEFATWFASSGNNQDSAQVLAEMPDAIPCAALIQEGHFKRS